MTNMGSMFSKNDIKLGTTKIEISKYKLNQKESKFPVFFFVIDT